MIQPLSIASITSSTLGAPSPIPHPDPQSKDFGVMLSTIVDQFINTVQAGENAAKLGLLGAIPAHHAVDALMNADRTLQGALAIRDKAISAYQELLRISI